jgi:uncharacterized protein (TIGR03000 family)
LKEALSLDLFFSAAFLSLALQWPRQKFTVDPGSNFGSSGSAGRAGPLDITLFVSNPGRSGSARRAYLKFEGKRPAMMSFLVTMALAGTTPAQGYGGYAGYGEYGSYGGHAWGTLCLPPAYLGPVPSYLGPAPKLPSGPADVDGQIDQKIRELQKILDLLNKRLKEMEQKQKKLQKRVKGAEVGIQTLADIQEDMAHAVGNRLADLKILARTLELKIAEESLRQKTEALAAAEHQRREMARVEADVHQLQKKPAQDKFARTLIRDLEQHIAALDAMMKTKLEAIEDQSKMRQHFSRLDQRMQQIEEQFGLGQKIADKPAIPVNRALVTVSLPAAAKLFVNDQLTKGEGGRRSFFTPELKIGTTYSYTLRMETMRNGAMMSSSQQIYFRAGKAVYVDFEGGNVSDVRPAISP